jgi:hypothetical protein
MRAWKLRRTITLLTIPTVVFFLMQAYTIGLIMLTRRDHSMPPWLGFNGFGIGIMAFLCSLPALAFVARSDIQGPLRYLLIAVHTLWFVIGGLISLFALLMFVVHPLYSRWVAH